MTIESPAQQDSSRGVGNWTTHDDIGPTPRIERVHHHAVDESRQHQVLTHRQKPAGLREYHHRRCPVRHPQLQLLTPARGEVEPGDRLSGRSGHHRRAGSQCDSGEGIDRVGGLDERCARQVVGLSGPLAGQRDHRAVRAHACIEDVAELKDGAGGSS